MEIKIMIIGQTHGMHNDITVRKGDLVKQGDCVGKVGDTGFTLKTGKDASHLHLELCENGKQVNPLYLLPI